MTLMEILAEIERLTALVRAHFEGQHAAVWGSHAPPKTVATGGDQQKPPAAPARAEPPPAAQPVSAAPRPVVLATALDDWPGGKLSPVAFVAMLRPAALQSERATGVPAAITIAQAALETGWGSSTIAQAKNLFGIKGEGPAGSVEAPTHEHADGVLTATTAKFRAYHSWQESIDDHGAFLQHARYATAMAVKNDPEAFARAIQAAGYASDPTYADQLIAIMQRYNLESSQSLGRDPGVPGGLTRAHVVSRARSLVGKPVLYELGAQPVIVDDVTLAGTKSDCSGLGDAACGIDRNVTGENTAAVVKDATGAQRYFRKVADTMAGPCKHGAVCVYTAEPFGHMGIVTEIDETGKPTMIVDCSSTNPAGHAVQEHGPEVFVKHNAILVDAVTIVD